MHAPSPSHAQLMPNFQEAGKPSRSIQLLPPFVVLAIAPLPLTMQTPDEAHATRSVGWNATWNGSGDAGCQVAPPSRVAITSGVGRNALLSVDEATCRQKSRPVHPMDPGRLADG